MKSRLPTTARLPSPLVRLPRMPRTPIAWALLTLAAAAQAQDAAPRPAAPASAAAAAPAARSASAPAARPTPAAPTQQIEVTGTRQNDTEQRRQATAAKIVIGREEIDRFGDSTLGEVLKRLPGVTTAGPPGRGGPPRMRGLGAGYTQILIDGQRVPPGFSLESLTPEQVERIEILRAPTAETGARAIGGTINIITREGFKRRLNDLRLGFAYENGQFTPGVFWTRNDSVDDLIYTISASMFRNKRESGGLTYTTKTRLSDGALLSDQAETSQGTDTRVGLNVTSRLQWRLGQSGTLVLMPMVFHTRAEGERHYRLTQQLGGASSLFAPAYDLADSTSESRFTVGRLNLQWRQTLGDGLRMELNGVLSEARSRSESLRDEYVGGATTPLHRRDTANTRDRTTTLGTKFSKLLEGDHSLVSGFEAEGLRRNETRITEQDNQDPLAEFEPDLSASSLRLAAYVQDEWAINPNWAAHAGVRWERITTRGDSGEGVRPENRSTVLTPLLHAVWKPDPNARDQIRMSLTRSYKAPTLQNLVARPVLSNGTNDATRPDRAGNPDLKPELATGVDVAFERYLPQGGVLSANVFYRRIRDYIRSTTTLEADPGWGSGPRWVSRPKNLGRAVTQGIELEAKFRLDQLVTGAPPVELRNNLSLFRSKVLEVPGPDNRLDEQPHATLNVGADYRFRGTPLTLGGSLNFTPGYRTQVSDLQSREAGVKRQFDAFALWVFNPAVQLRVLASNMLADDYLSRNAVDAGGLRTQASTVSPTYVNWQMRLELKL